jgi:anti-sigma factor ChrR (cupin superfamily)
MTSETKPPTSFSDSAKLAMWDDLVERSEEGDSIIAQLRHDLADRDAKLSTITAELGRLLALANVKVSQPHVGNATPL